MRHLHVCLAAAAISACDSSSPLAQPTSKEKTEVGRYAVIAGAEPGGAILLDTATGETWYQVSAGTGTDIVTEWLPMDKTTLGKWIAFNESVKKSNSN